MKQIVIAISGSSVVAHKKAQVVLEAALAACSLLVVADYADHHRCLVRCTASGLYR